MDKIDIRDLRVGDWLSVHHPTMPAENIKISADWIRTIERINNGLIKEDSPLFRIVEPIPLTTTIVEKNFNYAVYNEYGYYQLNEDFCLRGLDLKFFLCHWEDIEYSAYQCPKYLFSVDSVHQLQNLLRDLLIEKEITI